MWWVKADVCMRAAAFAVSSSVEGEGAMQCPDEVTLSPDEGEALIERIERETWTADDRRL